MPCSKSPLQSFQNLEFMTIRIDLDEDPAVGSFEMMLSGSPSLLLVFP